MKKVKNFARFYAIFSKMQGADEELKKEFVETFTGGRTTSLRDMTPAEYNLMCDSLQDSQSRNKKTAPTEIKRLRSAVLHRLQKMGVDTADWSKVDEFCLNTRIAGKKFYNLTAEELNLLIPKLEAIARKPKPETRKPKPAAPQPDPEAQLLTDTQLQYLIMNMNPGTLN